MTSPALQIRSRSLVQVANYPPGSTYGPRPLRDFEFVWVLRGSARWHLTGPGSSADVREIQLRPGILALARPGMTDSYRWDEGHPSSHAYAHFEVSPERSLETADWPLTRPFAGHHPLDALCGYLLDLAAAGTPPERDRSDQVLGLLLHLFLNGPFPHANADLRIPMQLLPALDHVRQVWEREGMRLVDVSELAAAARMSAGHFSRSFSAVFGCGPVSALELMRLGRAAVALQRSNLSISDIARHHGFADAYHFSKRFAVAYQLPPGRFRRQGETVDPVGPLAARGLLKLWANLAKDFTECDG